MKSVFVVALLPVASLWLTLPAKAESAAWLSVTAGPAWMDDSAGGWNEAALLEASTGLGSSPFRPVVLGGILRTSTFFGSGTDLALLGRVASRGYALGDFGAALDLGGYERFWGESSAGVVGSLTLGAPWGLVAAVGGNLGSGSTRGFTASLGLDFARLTVFRTSGENWWKNSFPMVEEDATKAR